MVKHYTSGFKSFLTIQLKSARKNLGTEDGGHTKGQGHVKRSRSQRDNSQGQ